eukprot:SAG22_NODE_352_length_11827_cov_3.941252_2_plen_1753_part_00
MLGRALLLLLAVSFLSPSDAITAAPPGSAAARAPSVESAAPRPAAASRPQPQRGHHGRHLFLPPQRVPAGTAAGRDRAPRPTEADPEPQPLKTDDGEGAPPAMQLHAPAARAMATSTRTGGVPSLDQVVRSDWLNVRDVGAVGDGQHDDTDALQKAINMLSTDTSGLSAGNPKQHLTLYFPPGDFRTTRTLELGANRTAHSTGGLQWVSLIGHGTATRIVWDGAGGNATMLWSNGCTRCRVEGLSFVGNHRAGVGIDHRSFSRYESRFLHINLAFEAFAVAGIRAGEKPYGTASAEMLYQNGLFSNSTTGLQLLAANQYDNSLQGCLFADCGIGLDDQVGNFYLRNSRFERSTDVDIVASAHSNSVRRVVSVNSSSFVRVNPTSASSELKIDDCRVAGWTKPGAAINFGARGPLQIIDSTFSDAPMGASAAIHMSESAARVVLSGSAATGVPLVLATQPSGTVVTQLPAAARMSGPNKAITSETQFLKEAWTGPSEVVDAHKDKHATGNGIADDTAALQATIDAVAAKNEGGKMTAVAYIPAGQYRIGEPLRVTEGVHLDGSGFGSQIVLAPTFAGEAGVVIVGGTKGGAATSAMLTNLAVVNQFANKTHPVRVRGGCGTVFVSNIHVDSNSYGCAEKPNVTEHGHASGCQSLGIHIDGLTQTDTLHANVLDGRLDVSDSADGVVLVGFHVQGGSAVSHPSPMRGPAKGFLGEIFRAESFNRFDLQVNDSQSYVISDYYTEQTWQYILLGGTAADKYPGRVSVGAVKVGTNQYRFPGDDDLMPVIEVDNFHGSLLHFGGHFQFETKRGNATTQRTPPLTLHRVGDAHIFGMFFGDTWLWQAPRWSVEGSQASVCTLGNIITMDALKNLTVDDRCEGSKGVTYEAQLQLVGAAWDHTRELGDWDLKLNYPNVAPAPAPQHHRMFLKTDDSVITADESPGAPGSYIKPGRTLPPLKTDDGAQMRRLLALVLITVGGLPRVVNATPKFLACGSDRSSRIREGGTVMGQLIERDAPGAPNITLNSGGLHVFEPGQNLTVELAGLGGSDFFAVRVSDGGGILAAAANARSVTSKCASQMYADEPGDASIPARITLSTPCASAAAVITISAVGAADPLSSFWFTDLTIKRAPAGVVAPHCPPPTPLPPPAYRFNLPLPEDCPKRGAAAQSGVPCPAMPCLFPDGKPGTCLTSSDGSTPAKNNSGGINAEARIEHLTDDVTPISNHFTTGSWPPTRAWEQDLTGWSVKIDGEVELPRSFTMAQLKELPVVTRRYVLECAGNWGRGLIPAGAQADWWNLGAVGCAEWTGVLLSDVLRLVGVKPSAVFVAYIGEDEGGLSRGVPIAKAVDNYTMLAYQMNGQPLPALHGFPLRMLAPGYPGSAQGKWLKRLWVRDRVHDGLGMNGKSYKLPKYPLRPGDYNAPDKDFEIFTTQPVRSLIVHPQRCTVSTNATITFSGKAWSGSGDITRVELSYTGGLSWVSAAVARPNNRWSWQRWEHTLTLPSPGVWDVFVRATDETGAAQPMLPTGWNPGGYSNNQAMKVDVEVTAGPFRVNGKNLTELLAVKTDDAEAADVSYYVSADAGDDDASGSESAPWRSLTHAQAMARVASLELGKIVTVNLLGGSFRLQSLNRNDRRLEEETFCVGARTKNTRQHSAAENVPLPSIDIISGRSCAPVNELTIPDSVAGLVAGHFRPGRSSNGGSFPVAGNHLISSTSVNCLDSALLFGCGYAGVGAAAAHFSETAYNMTNSMSDSHCGGSHP